MLGSSFLRSRAEAPRASNLRSFAEAQRPSPVWCAAALWVWILPVLSMACGGDSDGAAQQALDAQAAAPASRSAMDAMVRRGNYLLDASVAPSDAMSARPAKDSAMSAPEPEPEAEVEPDASVALGESMGARDSAYLFDQSALHTFELFLRNADLAKLDADPTAEVYVPGQLVFQGGLIPNVGIRYKGSTGSFLGCVSGGIFPPSGEKTCVKLGIKVKLDFGAKKTRFFGQKKVQFHAMNLDRSLLRERLGYSLFNAVGVHAPRTAHVRLLINGRLVGVFLLVEVIDDVFMKDRFEDQGAGNLYKEVWPVDDDAPRYLAALEETGTKPASAAKFASFGRELAAADEKALPAVAARWLDLDYMARYLAVDRAIRHDDGPYHWYCGASLTGEPWHMQRNYAGEPCGNHNYFWYEEARRNKLWLIPWDLDLSLPVGSGLAQITSRWDDLSVDCTELLPGGLSQQMPIACDPLQRAFALALRERVRENMRELINGPLSDQALDATLSPWIAQLAPAVEEARLAHDSEQDITTWSAQVDSLRSALSDLREAAAASLL